MDGACAGVEVASAVGRSEPEVPVLVGRRFGVVNCRGSMAGPALRVISPVGALEGPSLRAGTLREG